MLFDAWADRKPIVGVVHLKPLPGSPRWSGDWTGVILAALRDAEALVEGGVDGVIVENFGDAPFAAGPVAPATIAAMTAAAAEIRRRVEAPLGINVLRNDAVGAMSVAVASRADFIRVNVFVGARLTDQGVIQGAAAEVLRERARLRADGVRILADVDVKHSAPLADYGIEQEIEDALLRGGADAIIVTGGATGKAVDPERLARARRAAGKAPLFIGSGATAETLRALAATADGFIVGTAFKEGGDVARPVDPARVRAFVQRR